MKIKMEPLHGKFKTKGAMTPHHYHDFKIPMHDGEEKKAHLSLHEKGKRFTAQEPMSKRHIKEDGYTGESRPHGEHGEEAKNPHKVKGVA